MQLWVAQGMHFDTVLTNKSSPSSSHVQAQTNAHLTFGILLRPTVIDHPNNQIETNPLIPLNKEKCILHMKIKFYITPQIDSKTV